MVLTDDEWRLLDALRAGEPAADAGARATLATAAEKLRVASVGPGAVRAGGFVVPVRESCSFCEDIAGGHGEHGPPAVVVEDDLTRTLVCPITMGGMPGHSLVITRRHAETVFDLTVGEAQALGVAVAAVGRAIRDTFRPAGLLVQQHNGIAAYQTVPHVHVHVVPKVPGPYPGPAPPVPVPPDERAWLAAELRAALDA
jgi:histidine triad (HIT) family protein